MKLRLFLYIFFLVQIAGRAPAVELSGKIKINNDWHPEVFLASINNPEDLFVASPDFLLASALLNADGTFVFNNLELPDDPRFYRLYLVKNLFSPSDIINSGNRSIIHLIIDDNSNVVVEATLGQTSISDVIIMGSGYSSQNLEFDKELESRLLQLDGKQSKAQKEFIKLGIDNYIRAYVDSCENALNGLYALYHIEEKEPDFLRNSNFYFEFQEKLQSQFPNSLYTEKYDELLENLVGFRELVCEIPGVTPKWKDAVILIESGVIVVLLLLLSLNAVKRKNGTSKQRNPKPQELYQKLTNKEQEILKLVAGAKSNKEIALLLFIELSTVKTHLNSIYKQLKVQNRKEASAFYHQLNKK